MLCSTGERSLRDEEGRVALGAERVHPLRMAQLAQGRVRHVCGHLVTAPGRDLEVLRRHRAVPGTLLDVDAADLLGRARGDRDAGAQARQLDLELPDPLGVLLEVLRRGAGHVVLGRELAEVVARPGPRVAVELVEDVRLPIQRALGGGDEDLRALLRPVERPVGVVPVEGDALLGAEDAPVGVRDDRIGGVNPRRQGERDRQRQNGRGRRGRRARQWQPR